MTMNTIYVVGDKFERFSENQHVVTVKQLCKLAELNGFSPITRVVLGQGLSRMSVERIRTLIRDRGLEAVVDIVDLFTPKADRNLCHKHKPENSLISIPRKIDERTYETDMLIDDSCADMSDHMTGQHIQGMVLLEACRQTFIAITESFYTEGAPDHSRYFVINAINIKYMTFVFPLPTTIRYEIVDFEQRKHGNLYFRAYVRFFQCDKEACVAEVEFSTYNRGFLERREAMAANQHLEQYLSSFPSKAPRPSLLHSGGISAV